MAHLSINRIKTIMKTTDGADTMTKNSIFLVKIATEMFIRKLITESYQDIKEGRKLSYNNLVNVVHGTQRYEFLEYMIPKKITVREFKERLQQNASMANSSEDDSEDNESDKDN